MEKDTKDLISGLTFILIFLITLAMLHYFLADSNTTKNYNNWELIENGLYRKRIYGGWLLWTLDTRCSPTFIQLNHPDEWKLEIK